MAEVYLARRAGPHGFQKLVALKRILPQLARDEDFVAMFVDEARVCARLSHPNVVQVFDFGEHDGELFMAMEYVDGTTGARLIRAAAAAGIPLPIEVSLHIALSVLRGLEYAHNARDEKNQPLNLVHRDVSPGNLLIDRSGAVKLTDFGIARASEFERRTDAGQLKGKLGYMSPEQVVGAELDARSDIFTLGIVFAEMLTLRPLFSGGRELDVLLRIRDADLGALDRGNQEIDDEVKTVLYRALARDRSLRYPTATAFAEAIEEIIRRRRLQVGPARLAAFEQKLGLSSADRDNDGIEPSRPSVSRGRPTATDEAISTSGARDVSPQIYRVKTNEGTILGPMSYPRLIELFATGQIHPRTELSRESGAFREALHFGELARFVTSPALRWDEELHGNVERTMIDRASLPSYLFQIALERDTGALIFRDQHRRKKIYLVEGALEFVASTDKRELLGEYLVARGQVLRMEVDMALAMLPRFGGRLGDALVGLGVLRPIELFRAIHDQMQERFLDILSWKQGDLAFISGARSHEETFPLGVDSFELITRGIKEGYTLAELTELLEPIADDVLAPVPLPPLRIETLRLPESEAYVLKCLDEEISLGMLTARMRELEAATEEEVLRAVFIGLACDIIRSLRWTTLHPESGIQRAGAASIRFNR
jgi:serine/threonine-protein kinase